MRTPCACHALLAQRKLRTFFTDPDALEINDQLPTATAAAKRKRARGSGGKAAGKRKASLAAA